ncbi:uncharacterized protein LOC113289654 isoform X2 [Papaver somniferum]|uniref:uncharacterized protein LOC113289654 isoform X2 n=1 Tax=Papaver somniferum TaxID=3469 RepID=UPI000E6F7819|nr:uncharacterized protein LOC113289654 isoform X2 [Papaver somniferum]
MFMELNAQWDRAADQDEKCELLKGITSLYRQLNWIFAQMYGIDLVEKADPEKDNRRTEEIASSVPTQPPPEEQLVEEDVTEIQEVKSIPHVIEEEKFDLSDVVSSSFKEVESIPVGVEVKNDSTKSVNLQLEEVTEAAVNNFPRISQVGSGETRCEENETLKEFVIGNNKVITQNGQSI